MESSEYVFSDPVTTEPEPVDTRPELYNVDPTNNNVYKYNIKVGQDYRMIISNKFVKLFDLFGFEIEVIASTTPIIEGVYGCYRNKSGSQNEYYYSIRDSEGKYYIIIDSNVCTSFYEMESLESINSWFTERFKNYVSVEEQFSINRETGEITYISESTTMLLYQIVYTTGVLTIPDTVTSIIINSIEYNGEENLDYDPDRKCPSIIFPDPSLGGENGIQELKIMNIKRNINNFIGTMNLDFSTFLNTVLVINCEAISVQRFLAFANASVIKLLENTIVSSYANNYTGIDYNSYYASFNNLTSFTMDSYYFNDIQFVIWITTNSPNLTYIEMPAFMRRKYQNYVETDEAKNYRIMDTPRVINWHDIRMSRTDFQTVEVNIYYMMNDGYDIMYY